MSRAKGETGFCVVALLAAMFAGVWLGYRVGYHDGYADGWYGREAGFDSIDEEWLTEQRRIKREQEKAAAATGTGAK